MNKPRARPRKGLALAFTLLMVANLAPVSDATHTRDHPVAQAIGVLGLPHAYPTDECISVPVLTNHAAAAYTAILNANGAYFADNRGVPAICGLEGRPMTEWSVFIRELDRILDEFRNATAELERQFAARFEDSYPESTTPRVTLLLDRFDGRRLGGFGDWEVITPRGEEDHWATDRTVTSNGTTYTRRFGDDAGYARGVREFLVSPEIDLGAVRGRTDHVDMMRDLRDTSISQLYEMCTFDRVTKGESALIGVCGANAPASVLVDIWETALTQAWERAPGNNPYATLELTYRANFAEGADGVRVWVYSGPRPPDRIEINSANFSMGQMKGPSSSVGNPPATAQSRLQDPTGAPRREGWFLINGLPNQGTVSAFSEARGPALAITGHMQEFATATIDLTFHTGQRTWLVLEVMTRPDSGRGDVYFDRANFPELQRRYGFELSAVRAVGDAYPRNLRLKDIAEPSSVLPTDEAAALNLPVGTRIALPPGNEPLQLRVHNAGSYVENATLLVAFEGPGIAAEQRVPVRNVRPHEVVVVPVAWPEALRDRTIHDVRATLVVEDIRAAQNATGIADPDATRVRIPNSADHRIGGVITQSIKVYAFTHRELAAVPAALAGTITLETCGAPPNPTTRACDVLFAAKKGQPRYFQVGVVNRGSAVQDAKAILTLELDGVDKSSSIADDAERALPGMLLRERRALTWTVIPTDPGIYRATVNFLDMTGTPIGAPVTRLLYVQQTTGTICFDNMGDSRACGPSFSSVRPDELVGKTLTAAAHDPSGAVVATSRIGLFEGELFERGADGVWRSVDVISNAAFVHRFGPEALPPGGFGEIRALQYAPDGTLYAVGLNGTAFSRHPSGALSIHPVAAADAFGNTTPLVSAAWWNGTVWAAGGTGALYRLTNGAFERVEIPIPGGGGARVNNTIPLLTLLSHGGKLYAAGAEGFVVASSGGLWDEVASLERSTGRRTIQSLAVHEGRIYAAGLNGLVMILDNGTFVTSAALPAVLGRVDFIDIVSSHLGPLLFVSPNRVVTCGRCTTPANPAWSFPEISRPIVFDANGVDRLADFIAASADSDSTVLVTEGGSVFDYADLSRYDNSADWTTVPTLSPTGGGFVEIVAAKPQPQAFRGVPTDTSNQGSQIRVKVDHFVARASAAEPAVLRLIFSDAPTWYQPTTTLVHTCSPSPTVGQINACDVFLYDVARFPRATDSDRWTRYEVTLDLASMRDRIPARAGLVGLEFYKSVAGSGSGPWWAIDSALVETNVSGTWVPVLSYNGPAAPPCSSTVTTLCNRGTWRTQEKLRDMDSPLPVNPYSEKLWVERGPDAEVFQLDGASAWHVTRNLADRPVWVLNDELITADGLGGGGKARLRDEWNTRLVSPIIDLSQAYDPVVSFRHLHAFRMLYDESSNQATLGDGGFLEVQYARKGTECGPTMPASTECWSPWFRVYPVGNYTNRTALGMPGATVNMPPDVYFPAAIGVESADPDRSRSYWARNMPLNEEDAFAAARFAENYQEVRVHLTDPDNVRSMANVNVSGRQIRFAFHAVTMRGEQPGQLTNFNVTFPSFPSRPAGFPGEGWYVTDFKVLGARKLGIDLRASDLRFPVGYNADVIGIGPGTTVPLNVTVTNRGAFEALGYTGTLEVRRVVNALDGRGVVVDRLILPQQPVLDPGKSVNHTFQWNVPFVENAGYAFTFTLEPIGIAQDEDPTDNVVRKGTLSRPVIARTHKSLTVSFNVTPENATIDITRYVPIFLNNTGNVPLSGVEITRTIKALPASRVVDSRSWMTDRPIPAGTRVALPSVASAFDPVSDLFWKAPERANFHFAVDAIVRADNLRAPSVDTRVGAFATYLFDDIEAGPRGEAMSGDWNFEPGWGVTAPGFRSSLAYAFGESALGRYIANANSSAATPLVDISTARTARLAFYHRYQFEDGFDGGIVEASIDGGLTWAPITPLAENSRGLPHGYTTTPISPASAIHATGDPSDLTRAFTGRSSDLEGAVDGWFLTQFDLTDFPGVTESNISYETLRPLGFVNATELLEYEGLKVWSDPSWRIGAPNEFRYWEVQNLTEGRVKSIAGDDRYLWSGSASIRDDGTRPRANAFLNIPIDLRGIAPGGDEVVEIDWWEWAQKYAHSPAFLPPDRSTPNASESMGTLVWTDGSGGHTWRMNVTKPAVAGRDGQWMHLVATLNDSFKGKLFNITFAYTPVVDRTKPRLSPEAVRPAYLDDPGFAVDGLTVRTYRVINGQRTVPTVILNETDAYTRYTISTCNENYDSTSPSRLPCFADGAQNYRRSLTMHAAAGEELDDTWRVVTATPPTPTQWHVVTVTGTDGRPVSYPTGEVQQAWWTGDPTCGRGEPCMPGGSESRLVTPAVDLGIVAGTAAELRFQHRYGYGLGTPFGTPDTLPSGGVVEIQVFDPQTRTWSPWKQIYASNDERLSPGGFRGYTGYLVSETRTASGRMLRLDAPFEPHLNTTLGRDVQFGYTGRSSTQNLGWVTATFDLSEHIGKTVRFGFHDWRSGASRTTQGNHCVTIPRPDASPVCLAGWWIGDVEVVGRVLAGHPLSLRMRAGTDGNVQDGFWHVDDIGVYGGRYSRNVGIFLDPAIRHGAVANATATIPVTLRNLGDSVRRDLGVEVRQTTRGNAVRFSGQPGGYVDEAATVYRITGFNLAPGQSMAANFEIKAPETVPGRTTETLLFRLVEFNPSAGAYVPIADNEIQGFLTRLAPFVVDRESRPVLGTLRTGPAAPALGTPIEVRLPASNAGFLPFDVQAHCEAYGVTSYRPTNHRSGEGDVAEGTQAYPCVRIGGATTLAPGDSTELTFRITPTQSGFLKIRVNGTIIDGLVNATFGPLEASAVVGMSPVVFREEFHSADNITALQWKRFATEGVQGTAPLWSAERGHRALGSLLLGRNESFGPDYTQGDCAQGVCLAQSPRVDLHNFTQAVYLTFAHLPRIAFGDGVQVKAQVLLNEERPELESAWSPQIQPTGGCTLTPVGGYPGALWSYAPDPEGANAFPADINPGYPNPPLDVVASSAQRYFVSPGGQWADTWQTATFDLSNQPLCDVNNDGFVNAADRLIGRTVRFVFILYAGSTPTGAVGRGVGQGWFLDDVSVGPHALELRPGSQRATLLDNTTKDFHIVVRNNGTFPDRVRIVYDEGNSSAPQGSILPDSTPIELQPGESRLAKVGVTLPRDPTLLPAQFIARMRAESAFDPNAVGISDIELVFAPRKWADLRVTVDAPRTGVQEGTETFVPITIENNGLVESIASELLIIDEWPGACSGGTCRRETTLNIPSMRSYFQDSDDSTRILEFRWRPERGSVGLHKLTFIADPRERGEEYTRIDNVVTLLTPVSDLLIPDLSLEAADALRLRNAAGARIDAMRDADVTRFEVAAGELVSFDVKIRNEGRAGATSVDVRAFIGTLTLPAKTVPYIAPGGEVVVSFNWLAQKGDYNLEVVARTEQVELSTANNRYPVRGVTLLTVKGYEVEVHLGDILGLLEPGTEVPVPFSLTNTGNAGEEIRVVAQAPDGWTLLVPRDQFFLRAGETYDATATLQLPANAVAGEHFISVLAVSRENPMKASAARTAATVRAFYGGNIVPTVVVGAPPAATLPIRLVNEGNSLEPWMINVKLPAGWTVDGGMPRRIVVPAYDRTDLALRVVIPTGTPPGVRIMDVTATLPNGETRTSSVTLDLAPLRSASVALATPAPREAQGALAYELRIENAGNVRAPFEVILLGLPQDVEASVVPATFDLAPGEGATASLRLAPTSPRVEAGTYRVTTYALFRGVTPDTPEGRANMHDLDVNLLRPDLRAVSLDLAPRADVRAGERVVVKTAVANRGLSSVTDLAVHLYADDVFVAETRIPKLAAGETRDAVLNWTATPGAHTLTVVVDPYEDTVDVAREDNAMSTQIVVLTSAPIGGLAAGRLGIPSLGLVGLVAALAVAMMLLPMRRRPPG